MILLTGGTGFIGRNLIKTLDNVVAPSREELTLVDIKDVRRFCKQNNIESIIHCANDNNFKNNLLMFFNLASMRKKMIYFGSGAEYRFDDYGMAKGVMNGYTKLTKHIYNLRVYGCFGEGEKESRFITTCINEKHKGGEVIISKDSAFSYVYIKDLCKAVKVILDNKPKSQDYTIVGDEVRRLSEIADMVGVENKVIESSGEYFSNSEKFKTEFNFKFTPLEEAIREYEKSF